MNEYRIQRLKEDLTYAQQRNKNQKQQSANYKKVHEKDLKEVERLNSIIKETIEYIYENIDLQHDGDDYGYMEWVDLKTNTQDFVETLLDILKGDDKE